MITKLKYRCIRCLKDDRCGDGQMMQIDQCLCCTRYEPIFGQVYEIMNDIGVNAAQVLDDLQCSFMNNEEYIRMSRIEEYINSPKQGKFDLTKVLKDQGTDSNGFDDMWGNGIVMNWTPVPIEDQKPHINWRQSINNSGIEIGRLASWMDANSGMTAPIVNAVNNEKQTNVYIENQAAMDTHASNAEYSEYIEHGREFAKNKLDVARSDYLNNEKDIKEMIAGGTDLDVLAVLAAAVAYEGKDYKKIVDTYRSCAREIGSDHPVLVWIAFATSAEVVKMYVNGTLDAYLSNNTGNGTSGSSGTTEPATQQIPAPNIVETGIKLRFPNSDGELGKIYRITIHHLGAGFDHSAVNIDEDHARSHGWPSIGYHFVIRWDGTIERGCPEDKRGNHTWHNNTGNLGICVSGTWNNAGQNGGHPEPSQEQIQSLISLIAYLCQKYNITPSRENIRGHWEWPNSGNDNPAGCPGENLHAKMDSVVNAVATGSLTGYAAKNVLWIDCVEKIKKGLQKKGTASVDGLDLFPKICYMYVALMNDTQNSKYDGESGWGFPFTDTIMNKCNEKKVYFTGRYNEWREGTGKSEGHYHEGCDLQPGDCAANPSTDVPFVAVKEGTVHLKGQWCNAIYIQHSDGTFSRYLHCRKHLVSDGQHVNKGDEIGIVGGHDGTSETYAVHLHIEFGKQIPEKTPRERTITDNCGINPLDQWRAMDSSEKVGQSTGHWTFD